MKKKNPENPMAKYASQSQIATLLRLTPYQFKKYGFPREGHNEYDVVKCVQHYLDCLETEHKKELEKVAENIDYLNVEVDVKTQAAYLNNITVRQVNKLVTEGLIKNGRGNYPLFKNVLWYYNVWSKKDNRSENDKLLAAQIRKAEAAAEREERELSKERKYHFHVDDIVPLFEKIYELLSKKIPMWKKRAAPRVLKAQDEREAELILKEYETELLSELSTITDNARSLFKPSTDTD